jgi:hypothetical protein
MKILTWNQNVIICGHLLKVVLEKSILGNFFTSCETFDLFHYFNQFIFCSIKTYEDGNVYNF